MIRRIAGAALAAAALAGCGGRGSEALEILCGAGLRPPIEEIAAAFAKAHGIRVECDYAGSNVLLARLELTKRGDIFIPGDAHYVDLARERGLVERDADACLLVPVVLVAKGNPKGIRGVDDLARPGLRIALGDPKACAIGRLTAPILEKNGVAVADVDRNVVVRAVTVNELAVHMKAGKIDAAIVWDAVAKMIPEDGEIVEIPLEKNVVSTVPVAVLKSAKDPRRAAAFEAFAISAEARAIFRRHGYATEPPR
ncbi:MAG: molybdate ABC transporter substrate-binding protein [Planctomycetes bacterium]|nr:molybdate ABC transporter substrate-binding protein [Planctomycetota bacterium]